MSDAAYIVLHPASSLTDSQRGTNCGIEFTEPYGEYVGCGKAHCLSCGCHAGLYVRLVDGEVLSEIWGLPEM